MDTKLNKAASTDTPAFAAPSAISSHELTQAELQDTDAPQHAPSIIDSTLIPHTAFAKALKRMRVCFHRANGISDPQCLLIVGETGTGKTTVQETLYAAHRPQRLDDGLRMPILRAKVPANPTVKSFVTELLLGCQDPMAFKGTENEKTNRLKTLMRAMGTRMIQVDEANHFFDKGKHSLAHHVADWFKVLIDETKASVVASGIPIAAALLEQNEQLARRFLATVTLPRFRCTEPQAREEWTNILQAFHVALSQEFDVPELHGASIAFRFYLATGGLVGLLTKVLSVAEQDARAEGRKVITLADLEDALDAAITPSDRAGIVNPFSRTVEPVPTSELLAQIEKIGTTKPPEPRPRKSRGPRVKHIKGIF